MGLEYFKYTLHSKSKLNPFDNRLREGVLFKLDDAYCDYCPWEIFGDMGVDSLLAHIKSDGELPPVLQKQINLDRNRRKKEELPFLNHGFNSSASPVIKFKIQSFLESLESLDLDKVQRIRIDFNNTYSFQQVVKFWEDLSELIKSKIEFLEDPCPYTEQEWGELSSMGIPLALDRNQLGSNVLSIEYGIYKPNIDVSPGSFNKVVFSSYMGHDLGRYHCYLELLEKGDLELYHGINTPNLFHEQLELFHCVNGHCRPNLSAIELMYKNLEELTWKKLI